MSKRDNLSEIIKFAGTYISVCIGSGFATGQEIMQFFSAHGLISILSSIICMVLLSYCGARLLDIGKSKNLKSTNSIFTYLCGNSIGKFLKLFMPIFLLSSFIVMISGAGAAINQYYGINKTLGSLILVLLSLGSILLGMNKIIAILGNIGPVIIIISLGIGMVTIVRNYESFCCINEIISNLNMTKAVNSWWLTGIIYSGLNIIIVTPFLVGVGSTAKSRKNCVLGGILGGVIFMTAAIVLNLGIMSDIENMYITEIPTLYMADKIGPIVGVIFSMLLIAGIYTTAVPLLWSVCSSFAKERTKKFTQIAIMSSIIGFLGGRLNFALLVNFIYPISGVLGVVIMIGIFVRGLETYIEIVSKKLIKKYN